MAINRPSLQGLVSPLKHPGAAAHQAAARAQDKVNLDVDAALSILSAPIAWTPLTPTNSWTPYGPAVETSPAWCQEPNGRVWLRGMVAGGSVGTNIFVGQLPPPRLQWTLSCVTDDVVTPGRVTVTVKGNVQLTVGGTGFVSLNSLTYVP